METIFNDLLFESPAAQAEFLAAVSKMDKAEGEKLRSVLGKPSQFVGRVMSLQAAQEHWRQWALWQATEGAALEQGRRELAAENRAPAPTPLEREAGVRAKQEWHDAVEWAKNDEKQWAEWKRATIEYIAEQCRQADERRKSFVADKRRTKDQLTRGA